MQFKIPSTVIQYTYRDFIYLFVCLFIYVLAEQPDVESQSEREYRSTGVQEYSTQNRQTTDKK